MIARYDLHQFISGYDFFTWLVLVKAAGAHEIVIDATNPKCYKWSGTTTAERIASIIVPGCALAGLPCRFGTDGETITDPHIRNLTKFCEAGGVVPQLTSVLRPRRVDYTVTLRNTQRSHNRNSNEADWRVFAAEIGATIIPDYDDWPTPITDRMALYAGAKMNFFVLNGPAHLCGLSPYPMVAFDCQKLGDILQEQYGMKFKQGRFPWWRGEDQHAVWEPDNLDVLRGWFKRWQEGHRV